MAATCARFIAIQRQNTPRRHIPTPREIHQSLDKSRFIFRLSVDKAPILVMASIMLVIGPLHILAFAVSAELAKKCRALMVKAYPPQPAGSRMGTAQSERDFCRN